MTKQTAVVGSPQTRASDADSVLSKVRVILETLSDQEFGLGLSALARETALSKATIYRLCTELVQWGMLERAGHAFRLGPKLFELGSRVGPRRILRDQALPFMEDLFVAFRKTVHFAVADGVDVLYIEKLTGHDDFSTPSRVGIRRPLHCTAVGKAILAFSPAELLAQAISRGLSRQTRFTIAAPRVLAAELLEVRRTGVAFDREETKLGLCCIACPVFGNNGELVGAISISSSSASFNAADYSTGLKTKARAIGEQLERCGIPDVRLSPSHE